MLKKNLGQFKKNGIIALFTQKIVTKLSKIWGWDPGSEILDPEKTYSGSRIQGSKRHRIPVLDLQHCNGGQEAQRAVYWSQIRNTLKGSRNGKSTRSAFK
jgi:hypothetical protein